MALTSTREERVDPLDEGNVGRLSSLISPWARRSSIRRRIAGGVGRSGLWPSTHACKSAS